MWFKYAVSVCRRFSTRCFGICHFFLRYCGIGYLPMSPSYLGIVFVVDESMWPEEIGSLTPMSRLMHVMLQTSHMRIVLGWVCVIEHLVQQMIPDDSMFWSAVCGSRDVFLQSQTIQENKMGKFSGFTSILTEWTIKRVWLFILLISWGKFRQVRLKALVDFANQS